MNVGGCTAQSTGAGGNCFGCHVKAHPEWDMICETTHGCDPIPLTPAMLKALQDTDPRCAGSETVSAADVVALGAGYA